MIHINRTLPHKIFIFFILVFALGFAAGRYLPVSKKSITEPQSISGETSLPDDLNFKNLRAVWNLLNEKYVHPEKFSKETMVNGAIEGFVEGIDDPYTVYLNANDSKAFEESLNGQLEGIGAELEMRDGSVTVVSTLKETPAFRAGLLSEDIIAKVDGEPTGDLTLFQVVQKIRGKSGTPVVLTVFRKNGGGEPSVFDIKIIRGKIEIESVTYEKRADEIGVIEINQFSDDTTLEFRKIINNILLDRPDGLILDLRYNGGGYLDISIDIISEFIAGKKPAAQIKNRNPKNNETIYTHDTARVKDIPLVVLVNNGSASASEIVAGAIQDYKRGLIIGEQTFGKGSVQEIETLQDGATLRLTIAEWQTPLGRSINEIGITPDRIVEFPKTPVGKEDPQLDEAIRYLSSHN